MTRLKKVAEEIKPEAIRIFDEEDEVVAEIESAILLSKDCVMDIDGSKNEYVTGAVRHLQYGIALFLKELKLR